MSAPALGLSGTSLALGLFNTAQISSIKSQLESLSESASTRAEINVQTPAPLPVQRVEEISPLEETSFGDASSNETLELQQKIVELERFSNKVSTRSIQNTNNVTIKGDELNRLSTFVTDALVSVRERIASAENSISISESNIGINLTSIKDVVESVREANERIDLSDVNISDLGAGVTTLQQRMESSESNAVELSSQITKIVLSADATGDNVSLLDDLLTDTKDNLESLVDSWNKLSAVAFVNNGKLKATALESSFVNIGLKHNDAPNSAIHWTNNLSTGGWSSYLANKSGKAPDGTVVSNYGDCTGWSIHSRLGAKNDGFVLETSKGEGVFSVSGRGYLDLGANCRMSDLFSNACFSHRTRNSVGNYAIIQDGTGRTQLNSSSGRSLAINIGGEEKCKVEHKTSFTVHNAIGTNKVHDTHFNFNNVGENFIRNAEGKGTHFSYGKKSPSVSVNDGEVTISGKKMKASLQALEARVKALESRNYVQHGNRVRLKNKNNSQHLRKADKNNDAIVDGTGVSSRSEWYIENY